MAEHELCLKARGTFGGGVFLMDFLRKLRENLLGQTQKLKGENQSHMGKRGTIKCWDESALQEKLTETWDGGKKRGAEKKEMRKTDRRGSSRE